MSTFQVELVIAASVAALSRAKPKEDFKVVAHSLAGFLFQKLQRTLELTWGIYFVSSLFVIRQKIVQAEEQRFRKVAL